MARSKRFTFWEREWHEIQRLRVSATEQKRSAEELSTGLVKDIFAASFYTLLALATAISTFGLLSNSTATVIGAMIIAPLMIPIISLAYALVVGNWRLSSYSLARVLSGAGLTVLIAYVTTHVIGFRIPGSEILSRTEPTLLDLGVAIAAGIAGAFAKIRRSVSDAIPGVAISVALVPPLCVVGIGLALNESDNALGAFVLFLTNLIGIVLSAALVFLSQSYGSWRKAMGGLLFLLVTMLGIIFPLNLTFREMIVENRIRHAISLLSRDMPDSDGRIGEIEVEFEDDHVVVSVNVVQSPKKAIENIPTKLRKAQHYLAEKAGYPVSLNVIIFPIDTLEYEAPASSAEQDAFFDH